MAAAFEDIDAHAFRLVPQLQPQCRGRSRLRGGLGAKQESRGAPLLGHQLQAPQGRETNLRRPGQDDAFGKPTQRLFTSPQGFAAIGGSHQQQAFQAQAVTVQGRGVGDPRRVDEQQPAARLAGCRERGKQQAELTQARLGGDQLGDRAAGPAAAREAIVQRRMPGWKCGLCLADLAAFPQAGRVGQYVVE